ncbi:hypothetical protein Hanom_Chr08g00699601 [Helianthus anomalus]
MVSLIKKQWCRSNFFNYTLYLLHIIQWCRATPFFKVWLRHCSNPNIQPRHTSILHRCRL